MDSLYKTEQTDVLREQLDLPSGHVTPSQGTSVLLNLTGPTVMLTGSLMWLRWYAYLN